MCEYSVLVYVIFYDVMFVCIVEIDLDLCEVFGELLGIGMVKLDCYG